MTSDLAPMAPRGEEAHPLDLSILIVTWNSERWIDRCVRSIAAACEGLEYEVVIHDNASEDATLDRVRDAAVLPFPTGGAGSRALRVLRSDHNAGFAAATNAAFAASRGRYVFLLNPDCELAPRALTLLLEFLETHPGAAGAVPLLIDQGGRSQREFQLRRLPTFGSLAAEVLLLDKLFPRNGALARHRYRDLDLSEPRRIEQPAAAALLLRREAVDEVGAMDEQFAPAWFEDVDYCRRLNDLKKEIWIVPAAEARHYGGASLEHLRFAGFAGIWYRNMWLYARKWMRPAQAEALRWIIIAGMLLRTGAGVAGFHPPGVKRGDAFRAYRTVIGGALRRWSAR
jgi:GT2 family glycosyltransferase